MGGLLMQGLGTGEHEPGVRHDGDLGVTQIGLRRGQEGGTGPGLAIGRCDDPQGTVWRDMPLALAEDADPAVPEADQVGEGIVRCLIPNLADTKQL